MIEIKNLTYSYQEEEDQNKKEIVLKDVSLTIHKGEFVAVLGHNGSGKSTLAKHLNAILLPAGGKVYVEGLDTSDEDLMWEIRRRVGMVFQNPDNQIVATIVEEDVAFGPENLGVPPEEIRERVDMALKAVGLYEMRGEAPHNLSGGQKQRVAIAGIIAMMPQYIVFDEPTAMLDPNGRKEVMKAIQRLNKEYGLTIVLITHYMDEAAQAGRVVVMDHGQVIVDDTPQMAFANVTLLKEVGLDVPQVTDLLFGLRTHGVHVRYDILTVEECAQEIARVLNK